MPILINGILLLIFGLAAVFSVSIFESFSMTLKSANFTEPTNYYYFFQQLKSLVYVFIALFVVRKVPFKIMKTHKFATLLMILAFALQFLVFTPLGAEFGGARGWLNLPVIPNIQPSEFFKFAYVFYLSSWLLRKQSIIKTSQFFVNFIVTSGIFYLIFLFIPDFGTILILGSIALIMARYAGFSLKKVLAVLGIGVGIGIFAGLSLYIINPRFNYIKERFSYFMTLNQDEKVNQKEQVGRQNEQALWAIGGGGFWGEGYGKGLQKFGYIPEAQSDFIFAAFSEEIGFLGNCLLLFLYCRLFFYFLTHIQHIRDPQSRMIGIGIISILILQTFINIGVNIQILPNTGVTLPFISAGGTSLMISCIELLILYKILISEDARKVISKESLSSMGNEHKTSTLRKNSSQNLHF
ncbi:cell division protein FtsW [candidate division SR1 bacterium]|nr:cell division protein FtsW [candidate division SR1 bacterium]